MSNLIKLYGEYWNPDVVEWGAPGAGNAGVLAGKLKVGGSWYKANFFKAEGIYILYESFRVVYVGQAIEQGIGKRLRDHLTDRFAGRWDTFSWYSACKFNKTSSSVGMSGTRQISPKTVLDTLEALAIAIADPPLNRKREKLPDATEVFQPDTSHPSTVRHYLAEILRKLDE